MRLIKSCTEIACQSGFKASEETYPAAAGVMHAKLSMILGELDHLNSIRDQKPADYVRAINHIEDILCDIISEPC